MVQTAANLRNGDFEAAVDVSNPFFAKLTAAL